MELDQGLGGASPPGPAGNEDLFFRSVECDGGGAGPPHGGVVFSWDKVADGAIQALGVPPHMIKNGSFFGNLGCCVEIDISDIRYGGPP